MPADSTKKNLDKYRETRPDLVKYDLDPNSYNPTSYNAGDMTNEYKEFLKNYKQGFNRQLAPSYEQFVAENSRIKMAEQGKAQAEYDKQADQFNKIKQLVNPIDKSEFRLDPNALPSYYRSNIDKFSQGQEQERADLNATQELLKAYATGQASVAREQQKIANEQIINQLSSQMAGQAYNPLNLRSAQLAGAQAQINLNQQAVPQAQQERYNAINALLASQSGLRGQDLSAFLDEQKLAQARQAQVENAGIQGETLRAAQDMEIYNQLLREKYGYDALQAQKSAQSNQVWGNIIGGTIGAVGTGLAIAAMSDEKTKTKITKADPYIGEILSNFDNDYGINPMYTASVPSMTLSKQQKPMSDMEKLQISNMIGQSAGNLGKSIYDAMSDKPVQPVDIGAGRRYFSSQTLFSDEKTKNVEKMLDKLTPYIYEYKQKYQDDPRAGEGKHIGVMAQDLEKSDLGKTMVAKDQNNIKNIKIDPQTIGVLLASVAYLNSKVKKLEGK